jgi:short-chain fatty acids transporter
MLIQTALEIGVSIPKTIMALSYGDQWTNMLQPFWALPLLGITKLKAGEILPYTILLFIAGGIVFMSMLLIF